MISSLDITKTSSKVEVSVRLGLITLTETLIILDITIVVLLCIVRKKMVTTVSGTGNLFVNE